MPATRKLHTARSRQLRTSATDAERKLWHALQKLPLTNSHIRRQVPIGKHLVDFACLSAGLVVEADGGQHFTSEGMAVDAERDAWLAWLRALRCSILGRLRGTMLERSRKAHLIALILASFLLTGMAESAWSQPSPFSDNQPTAEQSEASGAPAAHRSEKVESVWKRTISDPITFFTLWIAVFTLVLAISTVGLWIVTWLSGRRQHKATRILQRAYLAVEGHGISPFGIIETLGMSVAKIGVRNVGHLPAREVRWFICGEISPDGKRSDFPIDETRFYGRNVVPPGTLMMRSQNCAFAQAGVGPFCDGKAHLYVWGEIRYLDGFGESRFTRFCHRYNHFGMRQIEEPGPLQGLSEIPGAGMRYHQYGNDAD